MHCLAVTHLPVDPRGDRDWIGVGPALAVIENYSCECLEIEIGQSLKGEGIGRTLARIKAERGLPLTITVNS